eukprot:g985.t1
MSNWGGGGTRAGMSTAKRQANFQGIGLNTEVKVDNRPVTREGMTGIRVKTAGPGRQVQDTSYFLGLLRSKNKELQDEISSFEREIEQHNSDSTMYQQLERRYESLITEVRQLEGQLADYNLAMDKHRTNTDPFQIASYQQNLRERNQQLAKEVDNIFMGRKQQEDRTRMIQEKISNFHEVMAQKMGELAPHKMEEYQNLQMEQQNLRDEVQRFKERIEEVKEQSNLMENEIKTNSWRNEFDAATRNLKRLRREQSDLQEEAEAMLLDPADAREYLLKKVKSSSNAIKRADERLAQLEEENEANERTLQELTTDIEERRGENNDSHKYEVLFQRDKEMSEFIENFDELKKKELKDQEKTKNMIVALLEHISRDLNRKNNMPSQSNLKAMKEDLSFKQRQVDASKSTQESLKRELEKRQGELEKIDGLETKIETELKSLKSKIEVMQEEMISFDDLEGLRTEADNTRRQLVVLAKKYKERRDTMRQQVSVLSSKYEEVKEALATSETAKALDAQEQRLRHAEQNLFKLSEFVETKGRETDYRNLKKECNQERLELNNLLIEKAKGSKIVLSRTK